jgi:hypothetical protein
LSHIRRTFDVAARKIQTCANLELESARSVIERADRRADAAASMPRVSNRTGTDDGTAPVRPEPAVELTDTHHPDIVLGSERSW